MSIRQSDPSNRSFMQPSSIPLQQCVDGIIAELCKESYEYDDNSHNDVSIEGLYSSIWQRFFSYQAALLQINLTDTEFQTESFPAKQKGSGNLSPSSQHKTKPKKHHDRNKWNNLLRINNVTNDRNSSRTRSSRQCSKSSAVMHISWPSALVSCQNSTLSFSSTIPLLGLLAVVFVTTIRVSRQTACSWRTISNWHYPRHVTLTKTLKIGSFIIKQFSTLKPDLKF